MNQSLLPAHFQPSPHEVAVHVWQAFFCHPIDQPSIDSISMISCSMWVATSRTNGLGSFRNRRTRSMCCS